MQKENLSIPTTITTERLNVRRYEPGEGAMYYKTGQKNRAHLTPYESGNVIMDLKNEEHAERIIHELIQEWNARNCFFMGAFSRTDGSFIGQIYVGPVNWHTPEFRVGYFVDVNQQGKGYITEAVTAVLGWLFNHLDAHRVSLECDSNNTRSIHVAERCGFTREGHFRENKKNTDGTFSNTLLFGLLADEWCANTSSKG